MRLQLFLLLLLLLLLLLVSCSSELCDGLPNAAPRARPVNVFDGFTFDDELDMLRVRMQELAAAVFKFVVVEATVTHAGEPKSLVFQENRALFAEFEGQVLHVALDSLPRQQDECAAGNASCSYSTHWQREGGQRNAIAAAIERYCAQPASSCSGDDVVLISDVDEIPRVHVVEQLRACGGFVFPVALQLRMHYYTVNSVWLAGDGSAWPWSHAKAATLSLLRQPHHSPYLLRLNSPPPRMALRDAGWHLSYFGGVDTIAKKIRHLAHQENNRAEVLQRSHILRCIVQHEDLFRRDIVVDGQTYRLAPAGEHLLLDLPAAELPLAWWRSAFIPQDEL